MLVYHAGFNPPARHIPDVVAHPCSQSIPEVEANGSEVPGHPGLCEAASKAVKQHPKRRHGVPRAT